ncbi:hypothetical protein KGY14_00600 [Ameyamaea chiangmaiensis]|uniref:DUF4148 domain-containing protein n=2 Tax=Ameyamaea chiangmaiensis TaxID=442969 RepID=A0A850P518_9PROT|nr:hypothetical protein [Ameyamaea chiangmaiensis]NVN39048.1 hypothetical protein [Ameyamaea chiangmaiensis]
MRKATLLVAGFGFAGMACSSHAAHAQRSPITDMEASRLTLDALTAVPVEHHVAYRRVAAHTSSRNAATVRAHAIATHGRAEVREVVYHPHTASHAIKRKTRHRT